MKRIEGASFRKRRVFSLAFCCALFVLFCLRPSYTRGEDVKRVLLLCSYHQGNPRTDRIVQGVFSGLGEKEAEIHVEYLDIARHNDEKCLANLEALLKSKFYYLPFHLIISVDDQALDFLLEHRNDFSPNTPIVFCGVDDFQYERIAGHRNITGVNETMDIEETIRIALQLHPKAKNLIAILGDYQPHWHRLLEIFRRVSPRFSDRVRIREIMNLKTTEAPKVLRAVSSDSVVLCLVGLLEDDEREALFEKSFRVLSENSAAPVYGIWEAALGSGMVGGRMVSGFRHGEAVAQLSLRVLHGEAVSNIPVVLKSPNITMFDWRALKRFGIRKKDLPSGSQVLFSPFSLYDRYRIWFWVIPCFFVIESWLLFTLLISRRRRSEATKALIESEKKYKDLYEEAPVGHMEYDTNGVITRVNRRELEMLGYTEEEMVGKPVWHFDVKREEAQGLTNAKLMGERGPGKNLKRTFKRKDGTTVPILIEDIVLRDKDDRIEGIRSIIQDITDLERAEEGQKEFQAQLSNAVEMVHLGPWEYDVANDLFTFNDHFYKIFRTTAEQVGGYTMSSAEYAERFLHPDDRDLVREETRKALETTDPNYSQQLEHRILYPDGTVGYITVRIFTVKDGGGQTIKTYGVNQDITESKKVAKRLRESEEKLARSKKMESLGLLASGVAHDLNNVLAGIVSYPELLLLDLPKDSKLRKPIQMIQDSGDRAVALVQDLLTIARGVASAKEIINLNDVIGEYLISPEFERLEQFHPDIEFKKDLDTDLLNISGSPIHIRKAIMNLVSNASEAIEGSGKVTISTMNRYVDRPISGYEDVGKGEYVVLTISDDGSGISTDDLKRIFEPFFSKKVMGRSGTGLGLAVVWNIVQDHEGYIDVSSGQDGTTFELYFPITGDRLTAKDRSISIEDYRGKGEMILIIDDVESQREITRNMLETLGYRSYAVSSGEEAVEYLKDHRVDLILLDMIMAPGINGRETYEEIIKIHPRQKAIIVSGLAETDEVKKTQRLGAGKYMKKPLRLLEIGSAIKEELEKP
ncbi:MAG: PAS domain S-box protein [Deltaproteobacteria bacterium]|nr:PAS domain S-box protein [Deltaproteobacteria bacterium]